MRKADDGRMSTPSKGYQGVVTKPGSGMKSNFGTNGSTASKITKDKISTGKVRKP